MKTRTPKLSREQIEKNKEEFYSSIPENEKVPVTEEQFDSVLHAIVNARPLVAGSIKKGKKKS
jgi:hypothetical protein